MILPKIPIRETMNRDTLLAPIAGTSPCGEDLSFSNEFDHIAEMRRQDDPTLNQGEWVTTLKVANWPGVAQLCAQLLSERSKDLRLAMWLTEAWALTEGYAGLRDGLTLCASLCQQYWPDLHPQADHGDMEERIGNIAWLLHRLVGLADTRPIVRSRQGSTYHLQNWRDIRVVPASGPDRQPTDADSVTPEQFNRALRDTPKEQLRADLDALQAAHAQLLHWQTVIDGLLGDNGPGFVSAKEAMEQAVHDLTRLAREAGALNEAVPSVSPAPLAEGQTQNALQDLVMASSQTAGPLRTRAQALQQLSDVAAFFRKTEPHSPVAYLAEKAVKWGDMPLHEWLRQVVKDQGAMSHLHELLGIEAEGADPQSY